MTQTRTINKLQIKLNQESGDSRAEIIDLAGKAASLMAQEALDGKGHLELIVKDGEFHAKMTEENK